ncbi:MAG: MFS transporter [Endomicrobium sp.]|jgi:MFS family permease|nr:MFS transporter [Endomicrobium sp.]
MNKSVLQNNFTNLEKTPDDILPSVELGVPELKAPLFTLAFITLFFLNFAIFMVLDILLATMPIYLLSNGMSEAQIGVIFGAVFIAAILVRFSSGKLVTLIKPLWLLRAGFLCLALGNAVIFLFDNFINFTVSRLIFGAGIGIASTMVVSITSSIIPKNRMGEGLSFLALSASIALTIGPFIGIYLFEEYEFTGVMFTVIAICLVGALLSLTLRGDKFNQSFSFKERPPLIPDREVLAAAILIFFLGLSTCGIFTYLVLYLNEIKIEAVVRFFTIAACSIVFMRLFSGKVHDRLGHFFIVLPGSILLIISELILLIYPGPNSIILAAICFGFGIGALLPSLQAIAVNAVPAEKRTAAAAAFLNGYDIGQGTGIVILGFLSEFFHSYRYVYLATPIFMVCLLVIYQASSLFEKGKRI